MYSGPIAASAFAEVPGHSYARVLLIGPPHYVSVRGIAASSAKAFATPLGDVPIDTDAIGYLVDQGVVSTDDRAHAPEHSLEVELPFLQTVLGDFTLIPLLVVSTDLSHYLDDVSAKARDRATAAAIERLDYATLGPYEACGFSALNGALCAAQERGWMIRRLDLRNSGDTSGDRSRVVGYGAWSISAKPAD